MTLKQMSQEYHLAAEKLRQRLAFLRRQVKLTQDQERLWRLRREIAELTPVLTQLNELAELTAHYYDRGYYRNAHYTL